MLGETFVLPMDNLVSLLVENPTYIKKAKLIAGRSNQEFAAQVARQLNLPLTNVKFTDFANTEINVEIKDQIRGSHVYILQTGCAYEGRSVNDHLLELFALINACELANVKSICVVMPCYPYARSDKKDKPHIPIMASFLAGILQKISLVKNNIFMDLHAGQIQGFFNGTPAHNLWAIDVHCENLKNTIFKGMTSKEINDKFTVASADVGGAKRTESYAKKMGMSYVLMHKHRDYTVPNCVEGTILLGCVKNKIVIVVDDIIDTLGTMIAAVEELKKNGAIGVILVATHGIFSGQAINRLNNCDMITEAFVTNTIPQKINQLLSTKIKVVDVSPIFAMTITAIETGEISIGSLFK